MRVGELKELLEELGEEGDDLELRIAHQPNWPLCLTVAAVRTPGDDIEPPDCPYHEGYCVGHLIREDQADEMYRAGDVCEEAPDDDPRDRREGYVWIVGIDHPYDESPYAPRWVFDE